MKKGITLSTWSTLGLIFLFSSSSFGDCGYFKSEADLIKGVEGTPEIEKEAHFLAASGKQERAVGGLYQYSGEAAPRNYLVMHKSSGGIEVAALGDSCGFAPGGITEMTTARIHPDRDSILIRYGARGNGTAAEGLETIAVVDTKTCHEVGVCVDHPGYGFADLDQIKRLQFAKERAYLEKAALERGFPTRELVKKESDNPKWSQQVWILNNDSFFSNSSTDGKLKLQWYPWDDVACSLNEGKTYRSDPYLLKVNDRSVTVCDIQMRQWTTLYVETGYRAYLDSLELKGSQATVDNHRGRTAVFTLGQWKFHKND